MHGTTNKNADILKQLINTKCGKRRHLIGGSTLNSSLQENLHNIID